MSHTRSSDGSRRNAASLLESVQHEIETEPELVGMAPAVLHRTDGGLREVGVGGSHLCEHVVADRFEAELGRVAHRESRPEGG